MTSLSTAAGIEGQGLAPNNQHYMGSGGNEGTGEVQCTLCKCTA